MQPKKLVYDSEGKMQLAQAALTEEESIRDLKMTGEVGVWGTWKYGLRLYEDD